jgi:hypothetical protein
MDNSNGISSSITQQNIASSTNTLNASSNEDVGFLNSIKSVSITTWIIIFFIFSFLGFNVFVYLAKGTEDITNFLAPLIKASLSLFAYMTGSVVDVTASGAQNILNRTTDVADAGLTTIQNKAQQFQENPIPTTKLPSQPVKQTNKQPDLMSNNALNQSLNTATASQNSHNNNDYQADESTSTIQSGGNKSGWCYIGEDRGFRSCVEVGQQDKCMSGDIFPSKDICVNPSLRS